MCTRCWLRGWSLLGLFNTISGCLFNRLLVKIVDIETQETLSWFWCKAAEYDRDNPGLDKF